MQRETQDGKEKVVQDGFLRDKRERLLFWIILIMAVTVRCVGFVSVPCGVNQDEAMAGVDAWALSEYATDRFGVFMPVHLTAWGYGQMSALLSYCMVPFIRLFGFGTFAVRLPMLLVSCASVILSYLVGKRIYSRRMGLLVMALTAVNPWHFMQSRWSLDCNLFPHVFLLAFYLLLLGLEKHKILYLSMVFFGLTLYCYGVACYAVIPFLLLFGIWCVRSGKIGLRRFFVCAAVFLVVALPELTVMFLNFFRLPTVKTPFFTMSFFPESVRSSDILFLNFSVNQLIKNFTAMLRTAFLQRPDAIYNALPDFGPMYYISVPFIFYGLAVYVKELRQERTNACRVAFGLYFLMGIWVGLVTREVNVNRINIIFFPLIILCARGIAKASEKLRGLFKAVSAAYLVCFSLFLASYFTDFASQIRTYFNVDFMNIVKTADGLEEYDRLYITSNADWQTNRKMTEILTQYACRIDAAYYQEKTCVNGGRKLLPYSQRYHFIDMENVKEREVGGLYLVHRTELEKLPFSYDIIDAEGNFFLLKPVEDLAQTVSITPGKGEMVLYNP